MRLFALLTLFFISITVTAQDPVIQLKARILNDDSGKPFQGAVIETYKNDTLFRSDTTLSNGRIFIDKLPLEVEYKFVIKKQGYVSKIASLDARLTHNDPLPMIEYPMRFNVSLFETCSASDFAFMQTEPIIKFHIHTSGNIQFDKEHLKMMKKKMLQAKNAKLSAEDRAAFSSYYNNGTELMKTKKYSEGLDQLLEAKKIVDCAYVLDKIKKCERALKIENSYNVAIEKGDVFFHEGKFSEASEQYKHANIIKPDEEYPLNQLTEIQHKEILKKAHLYFEHKNYAQALELYEQALKLKPSDTSFEKKRTKCIRKIK